MASDEAWLRGEGLRVITNQAIDLAQQHLALLQRYCTLGDDRAAIKKVVDDYIHAVLSAADARRIANQQAKRGYGGPWPHIIELFSEVGVLVRRLIGDQDALCGRKPGVAPPAALAQCLRWYCASVDATLRSGDNATGYQNWKRIERICEACGDLFLTPDQLLGEDFLACLEGRIRDALAKAEAVGKPDHKLPQDKDPRRFREKLVAFLRTWHPALAPLSMHGTNDADGAEFYLLDAQPLDRVQAVIAGTDARALLNIPLNRARRALPPTRLACFEHWLAEQEGWIQEGGLTGRKKREAEIRSNLCARLGLSPEEYDEHVAEAKRHMARELRKFLKPGA